MSESGAHFAVFEVAGGNNSNLSEQVERRSNRPTLFAVIARWLRVPARVQVTGQSMLPTLEQGDHLVVRRTSRARRGDLVVFSRPGSERFFFVKRVIEVHRNGFEVMGDNRGASTDSKDFGLVEPARLLGIAWFRYLPLSRVGRVR